MPKAVWASYTAMGRHAWPGKRNRALLQGFGKRYLGRKNESRKPRSRGTAANSGCLEGVEVPGS